MTRTSCTSGLSGGLWFLMVILQDCPANNSSNAGLGGIPVALSPRMGYNGDIPSSRPDGSARSAERPRVRKVRAPQGGIAANGSRGRPQGQCNREIPPRALRGKGGKAR